MSKWAGYLGFGEQVETSPGIWRDRIVRKRARGNIISNNRNDGGDVLGQGQNFNPPVTLRNQVSVVMDAYSSRHYMNLRYVEWNGIKWRVTGVHEQVPRCNITLGTVWISESGEEEVDYNDVY